MQAVIVAAGKSSRLYPRTLDFPKSLLPVNGKPMIRHSIEHLKSVGVTEIFVVVGYSYKKLKQELGTEVNYIANPFFADCNNMGSLWFAHEKIKEDFFYLHADIMYEKSVLQNCLSTAKDSDCLMSLAVDFDAQLDAETMNVLVDDKKYLVESSKSLDIKKAHGEWTGISYIKKPEIVFSAIEDYLLNTDKNSYDTAVFSQLAEKYPVICSETNLAKWMEIDFEQDYQNALKTFEQIENQHL